MRWNSLKFVQLLLIAIIIIGGVSWFTVLFNHSAVPVEKVSELQSQIEVLKGSVGNLRSQLSRAMCTAVLSSARAICLDTEPGVQKSQPNPNCCEPRRVNLANVAPPASDFWKYHAATLHGRNIGFWINTHNPVTEDAYVSRAVHADSLWETDIVSTFARCLLGTGARDQIVVDVGANLGYFTLWSAAMGRRVVAFEPMN